MAVKINNIEYSGFFFNGEALTAMYLNGNKVYGSESQPQEYSITLTPVEWVSNENISTRIWLDLGYVWKNNSRAQLGFVIPGTHQKPNGQQVFGEDTVWSSDGNGPVDDNNDLRLFFTKSGSNIGAYWDVATSRTQATIGAITDVWQDWEIGNNYIKNLSNNTNLVVGSSYNISRTGTVGLYGACQYLNTGRTDCVRYSYVKIYEGDTLVKDIIPVLDNNNIPCFFDKISEELIYYKVNGEPSTGLTAGNATGSTIKIVYSESSVTISNSSVSGITIGNTFNLNASVVPTGSTLTYTSSNPSVASVDSNGIVSGVASGSTTITITASEYVDDENRVVYRSGTTTVNLSVEEATSFNPLTDSKYFVIQARSATTVSLNTTGSPSGSILYRKNGSGDWTTLSSSVSLVKGNYIELKGDVVNTSSDYISFSTSEASSIDIGGCLMALNQNTEITSTLLNQLTNTYTFTFCFLFSGCTGLVSAKHLTMASNTTMGCYASMFKDCTSLTTAPTLSATRLTNNCYISMFNGCTSLVNPPTLPATTLAPGCYQQMFSGCTSLVNPPTLPATTLAPNCYYGMFQDCTSLTTGPDLLASTLQGNCYREMFKNCTSLTTAPVLSATTLANNCYYGMFQDCTSLTTGPDLLATTLQNYCYREMFKNCTSLTTAPVLSATTLATGCYQQMFSGCTSLTSAPVLSATTLANYCYTEMFAGCTNLTTAPDLPASTLQGSCYREMFKNCTSLTTAPVLSATTLANYCYTEMFAGCTNLTTGPDLLATTLQNYCYRDMFNGCTSLTSLRVGFSTISGSNPLAQWMTGIKTQGVLYAPSDASYSNTDAKLPSTWTLSKTL